MEPKTDVEKMGFSFRMWMWMAKNPGKQKSDFPEWESFTDHEIPPHFCYACEIAGQEKDEAIKPHLCLAKCPVVWPDTICLNDGLYSKWEQTDSIKEKTKLATQIAELHKDAGERMEKVKTEKHYEMEKAKRGALLEEKWEVTSHAIYVPHYGIIARRPYEKDNKRGHDNWQNFGHFILGMKAFIEKMVGHGYSEAKEILDELDKEKK